MQEKTEQTLSDNKPLILFFTHMNYLRGHLKALLQYGDSLDKSFADALKDFHDQTKFYTDYARRYQDILKQGMTVIQLQASFAKAYRQLNKKFRTKLKFAPKVIVSQKGRCHNKIPVKNGLHQSVKLRGNAFVKEANFIISYDFQRLTIPSTEKIGGIKTQTLYEIVSQDRTEDMLALLRRSVSANTILASSMTLLNVATIFGCIDMINLLLEYGADVNAPNNGTHLLTLAARLPVSDGIEVANLYLSLPTEKLKHQVSMNHTSTIQEAMKMKNLVFIDHLSKADSDLFKDLVMPLKQVFCSLPRDFFLTSITFVQPCYFQLPFSLESTQKWIEIDRLNIKETIQSVKKESGGKVGLEEINEAIVGSPLILAAKVNNSCFPSLMSFIDEEYYEDALIALLCECLNQRNAIGFQSLLSRYVDYYSEVSTDDDGWNEPIFNDCTLLHLAVLSNDLGIVKCVVELGRANVNVSEDYGLTPLHLAVINENLEIVDYLINQGAEIDPVDYLTQTPLFYAVFNRQVPMVNLLVDKGANKKHLNWHEVTPFSYALVLGLDACPGFLYDEGIDLDKKDRNGSRLLSIFSARGNLAMCQWLIGKGSQLEVANERITPLEYATLAKHKEVATYLLSQYTEQALSPRISGRKKKASLLANVHKPKTRRPSSRNATNRSQVIVKRLSNLFSRFKKDDEVSWRVKRVRRPGNDCYRVTVSGNHLDILASTVQAVIGWSMTMQYKKISYLFCVVKGEKLLDLNKINSDDLFEHYHRQKSKPPTADLTVEQTAIEIKPKRLRDEVRVVCQILACLPDYQIRFLKEPKNQVRISHHYERTTLDVKLTYHSGQQVDGKAEPMAIMKAMVTFLSNFSQGEVTSFNTPGKTHYAFRIKSKFNSNEAFKENYSDGNIKSWQNGFIDSIRNEMEKQANEAERRQQAQKKWDSSRLSRAVGTEREKKSVTQQLWLFGSFSLPELGLTHDSSDPSNRVSLKK